ncbi:T9SS type A sorting domain-containing protein, partial [Candidatus Neomarinimicrobiota bacterium]
GGDAGIGYLEVKGDLYNTGWISLIAQEYSSYPTWFTHADLIVSGGSFTNIGTIIDSSAIHPYTNRSITAATFNNQGIINSTTKNSNYPLEITTAGDPGVYTNSNYIYAGGNITFYNVGSFANTGTIQIDPAMTFRMNGFDESSAVTSTSGQIHGSGTLALSSLVLGQSLTFGDSLSIELSNSTSLSYSEPLVNENSITILSGSSLTAPGITNQGVLTVNSGSLISPVTNDSTFTSTVADITGTITNNATFGITGSTIAGAVTNNDSLNVQSGTSMSAGLINTTNAKLVVTADYPSGLSVDGNLVNEGLIILNPKTSSAYTLVSVTNGSLTNSPTGTIQGVTGITGTSTSYMDAKIVNEGLFDNHFRIAIRDSSFTNGTGIIHINQAAAGTYQSFNSTLVIQNGASLVNTGTVILDTTASLSISDGTYQGEGGTLDGTGTLSLSKSVGHLGQKFVVNDAGIKLSMNASTIYVDSLINQATLTARGNTVFAESVIINQGKLALQPYSSNGYYYNNWHGPFINKDTLIVEPFPQYTATHVTANEVLGGPVVNEAGAVLLIQSSLHGNATLSVDSSLTNYGHLTLANDTAATYNYNVDLNVNKGWLTNTSTGVITQTANGSWEANINNQGLISINPVSTFYWNPYPLTVINSGTIDVQGGDFFRMTNLDSLVIPANGVLRIATGAKVEIHGHVGSTGDPFRMPDSRFVIDPDGMIDLLGTIEAISVILEPGPMLQIDEAQRVYLKNSHVATQTVNNDGHLTLENVTIAGALINADTLLIGTHGVMADTSLENQAGAYMEASSIYSNFWTQVKSTEAFTNEGELVLTNSNSNATGISLTVTTGNIFNGATGTIFAEAGASTSSSMEHKLLGHLFNVGLVNITAPTKLSWSGGDEHANDGTLVVDSLLTITGTGPFHNRAGTVSGKGVIEVVDGTTFVNAGTIAPGGSPGILTFDGDLAQTSTGVIDLEIAGTEPGTGYDQLIVTGNLDMAGSLNVNDIDSPAIPDMIFEAITWGSATGVFDAITAEISSNFLTVQFLDDGLYLIASLTGSGNSSPFIAGVGDLEMPEDSTLLVVLKAFDPDEGTVLTYSAFADTLAIEVTIVDDTLKLVPQPDWNGVANIMAMVSDGELSDTTEFPVNVLPVQDKPLAFNLLAPGDSIVAINTTTLYSYIYLSWEEAIDPDGDNLDYGVVFTDSLMVIPERLSYGSTSLGWSLNDIYSAMQSAGYLNIEGTWNVWAFDGIDTIWAENGPRHLRINDHTLGLDGRSGIPLVYNLHNNYPNPFNPTSTIQYDLPEATNVTLVVYDMLGREVISLVNRQEEPGYHQTVWDAVDHTGRPMPTGIYIARLVTPEYSKSIKMVLLK